MNTFITVGAVLIMTVSLLGFLELSDNIENGRLVPVKDSVYRCQKVLSNVGNKENKE